MSQALLAIFLKQSWSGTRVHDENLHTFSARFPESRRRFRKIRRYGGSFLYQVSPRDTYVPKHRVVPVRFHLT